VLPGKKYSPLDFAHMAWRRRWLIVVPFVVSVLATLVVSSKLPNQYQSETLIQVVPQQVPDAYVQSTVTIRTEDRLNALRQQVMSRTELERLITSFNLYPDERAQLPMQDVVELMRAHTIVDPVLGLNRGRQDAEAFYIRFTYHEAETAARVTERLGSLFIDQNARDRGALADTTDDFLQSQLGEARKRLEVQEQRLEQFREQHAGRLPSQLQFNMQAIQNTQLQLQSLVESLARDRDRKLMLERLYNDAQAIQGAPEATSPAPTTEPATPASEPARGGGSAQQQLVMARGLLARMEMRLKPEHPDIIRAKRQIRNLEQQAAKEAAQPPGSAPLVAASPEEALRRDRLRQQRAEIESVDRQIAFKEGEERRLRGIVSDYQGRIEAVPGIESEWVGLTRDYDTQQEAYKGLLSKSEQAKLAANLERRQVGEQFRILDPPRVPDRPIKPVRRTISAGGAAAGFFLGLMLAALFEFRDATFRTDREIIEVLALPVVAVVPSIESDADKRRKRRRQILVSTSVVVATVAGGLLFWTMKLWRYVV
jgi:polysaccharide chain length determinant protein (PEP-CTERM system associated)